MAERRLGIVKRVDLSGFAEGWDGCFGLISAVTFGELRQIKDIDTENTNDDQGLDMMIKFVKSHVVGGRVKVLEGSELVAADLQPEDVDSMSVEMVTHLFSEMTKVGAQYVDPKVSTQSTPNMSSSNDQSPAPDAPIAAS